MRAYTLRGYIAFFFGLTAVISVVAQFFGFGSAFINWSGAILLCAFSGMMVAGLYLMQPDTKPVVTTIALVSLIFIQARLTAFAVLPSEAIGFLQLEPFTADEISRTLAFMVVGTAALFFGIEAVAFFWPRSNTREMPSQMTFPAGGMVILWLLAATVNVAVNGFVNDGNLPPSMGWVARFFEVDVALLITVVWATISPPQKNSILMLAWGLIVFGLVLSIYGGSRGGAIRIASLILMAVSLLPHAKFSISKAVGFVVLVGALSVVSAMSGQLIRLANVTGESVSGGAMDVMVHDITRQDIYTKVAVPDLGTPSQINMPYQIAMPSQIRESAVKATNALNPILIRIGNFDYTALVLNRPGDETILNTYVRSPYALQRIINGLLPGDMFADTLLSTAQVINIAYRGYSVDHALENYFSEPWTIWGLAGVMFGTWGAPLALFAVGAALQLGFSGVSRLPSPFAGVVQVMYLFGFVYGGTIMLGIDHTVQPMVHYAFATASAFSIIYGSEAILGSLSSKRRLPKPHKS